MQTIVFNFASSLYESSLCLSYLANTYTALLNNCIKQSSQHLIYVRIEIKFQIPCLKPFIHFNLAMSRELT